MRAVHTTLTIIEAVADAGSAGVSELARTTGIPKSSVQRILLAAADAGWVRRVDGPDATAWTLSPRALRIVRAGVGGDLRTAARPVMERLRDATEESVHLVQLDGADVVLLDRLPGRRPVQVVIPVGFRVPAHAAATGKAMLAALGSDALERVLATARPRLTERTVTDDADLRRALDDVRRSGFATNVGEWNTEVAAVAAAVVVDGEPVGAISVSGTPATIDAARVVDLGPLVISAAAEIAEAL